MTTDETTQSSVAEAARNLLRRGPGRPAGTSAKAKTAEKVESPKEKTYTGPVIKTSPKKRILLRELIKQDLPIWVQNTSTEITKRRKLKGGTITLQVGDGNSTRRLLIPPGSDPICLSDQADRESLSKCQDLFTCVERGALTLLDPEKAEEYYTKNEHRRGVAEKKIENELNKIQETTPVAAVTDTEVTVDPGVIDICLFLKHAVENVTDEEKIAQMMERLEENRGTYNAEDLTYLLNNGKFAPIKKWAKTELAALTPEDAA